MDNPSLTQKCSRHDCKNMILVDGSKTCDRCKLVNKKHKAAQRARKKANLADTRIEQLTGSKRGPDQELENSERQVQRQKTHHEGSSGSHLVSPSDDEDSTFFDDEPNESVGN
jgi:hypothetical protein